MNENNESARKTLEKRDEVDATATDLYACLKEQGIVVKC